MIPENPRVRFAPSPTGYLHVGGARTALFNWLLARKLGGTFVLRIEDTDENRSTPENTQAILDGMQWLGLTWDEGPFFQSDGYTRHREEAKTLMLKGYAYPIFADDFAEGEKRDPRPEIRDRALILSSKIQSSAQQELARRLLAEPYAIAFRVADDGRTEWTDLVHEQMSFHNSTVEDFVILRSSGVPTYNLACASDDIEHGINVVLRGDDHIANTPKQLMLHYALWHSGACPKATGVAPKFGHLPMILGPDGSRLSKRHGATAVQQYAEYGIQPAALINFLALLGWNPKDDSEVMDVDTLVEKFRLDYVNKKSAIFDTTKLEWMNGKYLPSASTGEVTEGVQNVMIEAGEMGLAYQWAHADQARIYDLAAAFKTRCRTYAEIVEAVRPYLLDTYPTDEKARDKAFSKVESPEAVCTAAANALVEYGDTQIEDCLRQAADNIGVPFGKFVGVLRIALTGSASGPGIDDTVTLLGVDKAVNRLRAAVVQPVTAG